MIEKSGRIRIVHAWHAMGFGGVETMLVNIVNKQAETEDVTLLVINEPFEESLLQQIDKKVRLVRIGRRIGSKSPWPVFRLNYILLKLRPDIIHLHSPNMIKFVVPFIFVSKLCVTMHDICFAKNPNVPKLRRFRHIFAISQTVKESIARFTGLDSVVIPNGILPRTPCRPRMPQDGDEFRIVQVSRLLHYRKGQHLLIRALDELKKQGFDGVRLDFIGTGKSLSYLEELVRELSLQKEVRFLGAKSQEYIFRCLCEYDLLVQPSLFEGFGITVVEAMAVKLPVLVSANEGPFEIIGQGKYGFYFKNGDFLDCAEKIKKIMTEGVPSGMLELAHERAQTLYNVNRTAQRYLEEYRKILERCPRGFFRSRGKRG